MSKLLGYIGLDQYGNRYKMDCYPRKELLAQLGSSHASKMFVDTKDGKSKHVGYIIGGHWISVYEVHEWVGGNAV
jgi:hypothetical protein